VSTEMLIAFLRGVAKDYKVVFDMVRQLGDMVSEYCGTYADNLQDYFATRSVLVADAVLEAAGSRELRAGGTVRGVPLAPPVLSFAYRERPNGGLTPLWRSARRAWPRSGSCLHTLAEPVAHGVSARFTGLLCGRAKSRVNAADR
jgi:hypothetical protein